MIKIENTQEGKWEPMLNIGPHEGWDAQLDMTPFMVYKKWYQRFTLRYPYDYDIYLQDIRDGRPIADGVDVIEWLSESTTGAVTGAFFNQFYRKHPQAQSIQEATLLLRLANKGDLVMFKLRFGDLADTVRSRA